MIAYILIAVGFLMRLIPHVPNIVPVAAIALFAGATLNKKIVPWVPLAIMVFSDLIIGLHSTVMYTWGSFVIIGFIGMSIRAKKSPARIAGAAVFSALLFFAITNFGVWLAWYPHTAEGFVTCYIKAIPFLRNTMVGNALFALVFFGTYELARRFAEKTKLEAVLLIK